MSKLLVAAILGTFLLSSLSISAGPANQKDRQEMQKIKIEQAKLNAKERLIKLKLALNLQNDQMKTWTKYENHMLESAGKKMLMTKKLRRKKKASGKPPTSIDLSKANIARLERQLSAAKEKLDIFSELYTVLNEEQRSTVDKLTLSKVKKAAQKTRDMRKRERNKDMN